ncbi:MAG: hypothetical protein NWF02_07340 [Candidatus Bathyarchaeota archaeon]|nr:hypothetical protein [Candidatus Bathyarchaeum sp.]
MKELQKSKPYSWVTLGCHQRDILTVLYYCPVPLPLMKIVEFLSNQSNSPPSYFQIWRSLNKLKQKVLVQKIPRGYVITAKGLEHFNKRRNLIQQTNPLLKERNEASLNTGGCI